MKDQSGPRKEPEGNSVKLARRRRQEAIGALQISIPIVVLGLLLFFTSQLVPVDYANDLVKRLGWITFAVGSLIAIPTILVYVMR